MKDLISSEVDPLHWGFCTKGKRWYHFENEKELKGEPPFRIDAKDPIKCCSVCNRRRGDDD